MTTPPNGVAVLLVDLSLDGSNLFLQGIHPGLEGKELGPKPHLVQPLLDAARSSIGSLSGNTIEELVRDQVRQLRDVGARQKRLESLLISAYRRLPEPNHLDSIPGIGDVTAAVLTAFILDIDRFETPGKLVKYFGAMPVEVSSGVDRDGNPRGPKRYVMTSRGNDLVRRYLWMAALSAIRFNPAVRALYARVVAKHPDRKSVAVGHAMRKLLHLAFAIWKTRRPFDPKHYDWDRPAHVEQPGEPSRVSGRVLTPEAKPAAGLRSGAEPIRQEVSAADAEILPHTEAQGDSIAVFPEGTSTNGSRVAPFRAPLLAEAARGGLPVHYASLRYETLIVHGPRFPR